MGFIIFHLKWKIQLNLYIYEQNNKLNWSYIAQNIGTFKLTSIDFLSLIWSWYFIYQHYHHMSQLLCIVYPNDYREI